MFPLLATLFLIFDNFLIISLHMGYCVIMRSTGMSVSGDVEAIVFMAKLLPL